MWRSRSVGGVRGRGRRAGVNFRDIGYLGVWIWDLGLQNAKLTAIFFICTVLDLLKKIEGSQGSCGRIFGLYGSYVHYLSRNLKTAGTFGCLAATQVFFCSLGRMD